LNSPRQLYLSYLENAITLDLLDSIYFLDLLWQAQTRKWNLELVIFILILVFACVNFVLPTFALLKLRYVRMPSWIILPYEKLYALIYVLLVNVPYLAIRIYLYIILVDPASYQFTFDTNVQPALQVSNTSTTAVDYDIQIFVFKNIIMIYIALKEIYTRVQYVRQKRCNAEGGELIKAEQHDNIERVEISGPMPPAHQ